MGSAKISSTEIEGMRELQKLKMIPCMIVEMRPRISKTLSYFVIPCEKIQTKYHRAISVR